MLAEREIAVWALAAAAGFIVAVSFDALFHVEVAPMTGNTVATGVGLGTRGVEATFVRAIPILAFVLGVAGGVVIAEETARRRLRRTLAITIAVEIVLLVPFMVWAAQLYRDGAVRAGSHWVLDGVVVLPALALGFQTAALRRVRGQTARTTYVTGVLTRTAEESVRFLYWRRDVKHGETTAPWRNEPSLARIALLGGIFVSYAGGTILGAFLKTRWQMWSLAVPIGVLVLVVLADVVVASGPPSR